MAGLHDALFLFISGSADGGRGAIKRKQFAFILIGLLGVASGFQQVATPNATLYFNTSVGTSQTYHVMLYGNDENSTVNLSLSVEGDAANYMTVPQTLIMDPNPSNKCCVFYYVDIKVTLPNGTTAAPIRGAIMATENNPSSGGTSLVARTSKNLLITPQGALSSSSSPVFPAILQGFASAWISQYYPVLIILAVIAALFLIGFFINKRKKKPKKQRKFVEGGVESAKPSKA